MPFHPQPLFFVALGLVAGTLAPLPGVSAPLFAALGIAALLSMGAIARPGRVPLAALVVAAAAAGAALATEARDSYVRDAPPAIIADVSGPVVLEGRVVSDARRVDDEMRVDIDAARVLANGVRREYRGLVRVFVRNLSDPLPGPARPIIKTCSEEPSTCNGSYSSSISSMTVASSLWIVTSKSSSASRDDRYQPSNPERSLDRGTDFTHRPNFAGRDREIGRTGRGRPRMPYTGRGLRDRRSLAPRDP